MITFSEAKRILSESVETAPVTWVPVADALGRTVMEDVFSPIAQPPFHQSAVDGYAFRHADLSSMKSLRLAGEVAAGSVPSITLNPGECMRIFTGAQIPQGADTVVMQEYVTAEGTTIVISDNRILPGANIRPEGSHLAKGEKAIGKGTALNAAATGLLYGAGISLVKCVPEPVITLIITGNELLSQGTPPEPGKIYESNSYMLTALLREQGYHNTSFVFVKDDLSEINRAIIQALRNSDFIIVTGGISVGDYDYVEAVLQQQKVQQLFYKVRQKPGKPVYMGVKDKKIIFALPGNPASVWVCFFEYVLPALRKYSGVPDIFQQEIALPAMNRYSKKAGMVHFLKAFTDYQSVQILDGQESYKLKSFTYSNCLVVLPETAVEVHPGDKVQVQLTAVRQ